MARSDALNVVLVHGGFVDGSGWKGVYKLLKQDGYARAGATMIEEKGSHAIYVSQPKAVAALIAKAAAGVKVTSAGSEEAEQAGTRDSVQRNELEADRHAGA